MMAASPEREKRLRILLLCDDRPGNANTIVDHIGAFLTYSRHQVSTFNPIGMSRSIALDLGEFDAVVIHYSLVLSEERHVARGFRDKLKRFRGLKVQFIQDEYRWVDRATAASREIGIDVLFTAAPEPAAGLLYDARLPGVRRVETLTGYVPDALTRRPRQPLRERSIDVGYRGRDLPFWLGRLTQEKQWIAQGFLERAPAYGLRTDIAWREQDRIYGDRWIDFIASCRATLCTESGASIADFDGSAERAVRTYLRTHHGAGYEEVHDAVLRPYEGNVIVNVISPRVFEAASLGTGLVMFPGQYSGVVAPDDHYVVLEKDFSNMEAVITRLKDEQFMASMTERAYEHLVESGRWSYEAFMQEFDDVVAGEVAVARGRTRAPRYRLAKVERVLSVPPVHVRVAGGALSALSSIRGKDFTRRSELESGSWLAKSTLAIRAAVVDPDLRRVFREGRRAGISFDSLLEEILELSMLRRAAGGTLKTRERFGVDVEFDRSTDSLRFVSTLSEPGRTESPPVIPDGALEQLREGNIEVIEWDHRAVGSTVQLERPRVEVGIGSDGLKRYVLLVQIGRRRPALLERVLAPVIGIVKTPVSGLG
jgi:hypothetical protein